MRKVKQFFFALAAAFGFLSALPVRVPSAWLSLALRQAPVFFPVVGLAIGVFVACLGYGLSFVFPSPVIAALVAAAYWLTNRGLHMDGLADTADGFLSSRERERILTIMRDSRTGAMGVVAVVSTYVVKFASLAVLADSLGPSRFWRPLILAPFVGRVGILLVMALLNYARKTGGLAEVFAYARAGRAVRAAIWVVLAVVAAWVLGGTKSVYAELCALGAAALFSFYTYRKIGGYTGDTLGATNELAEVTFLLALVALG